MQVEAGASAIQLFDSWAGALTPHDYRASVMPHSARVLAAAGELGVPRIHFGVGTGSLLGLMGEAGADVVGVDWRTPLADAIPLVGDRAVQGNLDPTLVFAPTEVMTARAAEIIEAGRAAKGHIFNLGHGVIPSHRPRPARPADGVRAVLLSRVSSARSRQPRQGSPSGSADRGAEPPPQRQADQGEQHREGEHGAQRGQRDTHRVGERGPAVAQAGHEPRLRVVRGRRDVGGRDGDVEVDRRHAGLVGQVVALGLERLVLAAPLGDRVLEPQQLVDGGGAGAGRR